MHTILPTAVYFCMAIITICAHIWASYIIIHVVHKIIISAFRAVLGMPTEMYGERKRRDLQACRQCALYGWSPKSTRNTSVLIIFIG